MQTQIWDIDPGIDVDVDMDIDSDMAVSLTWGAALIRWYKVSSQWVHVAIWHILGR